jgi:hypothetical protein
VAPYNSRGSGGGRSVGWPFLLTVECRPEPPGAARRALRRRRSGQVVLELGGSPANPRVALFNLRAGPEPKPLWCTRWKSST